MNEFWKIEKWTGMVEISPAPGCIWWHLTVGDPHTPWVKNGVMFEAAEDADEGTLNSAASAKWQEILARKYPAGVQ